MKMSILPLVALTAAVICAIASPTRESPPVGGYQPIDNINDPKVQELGRWAVAEHVKQANDGLTFSKVVGGDYQVVSGINYRLVIDALKGDDKDARYQAVVYEQVWTNTRKLQSFGIVN